MALKKDSTLFRYFKVVLLCLFGCFSKSGSYAQDISFSHITTDNGLLSGNVRSLAEDHQGFIWIGTEEGLQRYDGYSMVTYKYNKQDTTSISGNVVLNIFEDRFRRLWIGTMNGLCLYDRKNNRFRRFTHDENDNHSINGNIVRAIFESKDGRVYFGFDDSGFSYCTSSATSPEKISFISFDVPHGEDNSLQGWVSSIAQAEDGSILLGGQRLFRFDPAGNKVTQVLQEFFFSNIHGITVDSKHRVWLATYGEGVYIYDRSFNLVAHHTNREGTGYLSDNKVDRVLEDKDGNFWIMSDKGLNLISATDDPLFDRPFKVYIHKENDPNSLLSNPIKASMLDRYDRLWLSSYFGGLNIYDKHAFKFQPIKSSDVEGSLSNGNVFAFEHDNNDNLWVGTDAGGVNVLKHAKENLFKKKYDRLDLKVGNRAVEKIKSLKIDRFNNLWVGTWGDGLFRVNLTTGRYEQFVNIPGDSRSLIGNEVMQLAIDSLDNLWIGTFSGLDCYNPKTNIFIHYSNLNKPNTALQVDRINAIHVHGSHLWIAHEVFGLHEFDYTNKTFVKHNISEVTEGISINTIHFGNRGFLWLGTNSTGLIRYNTSTRETKVYTEQHGLANNFVNAILQESDSDRLWLSTNNGLAEFDPESETFTNYYKADGLQSAQFNPNSAYYLNHQFILFGGISGFNAFDPKLINKSSRDFPIVFTHFWINNTETNVEFQNSPLKKNIIVSDTIVLSHTQNFIGIEFAMLEYSFSGSNRYKYFMQGLHDQWHDLNLDNKAFFTNLNPGTYTFKIKASNSDGIWSDSVKSIVIDIRPAWWQTTAFKVIIVLLLVLLTYSIFRFRLRYLLSIRKRLELQVRQRTLQLEQTNKDIADKNSEISAQNEELVAQHDQIMQQREELARSGARLKEVNENLEELVSKRTQRLKETITELDKTVAELDRFVYSASHDLSAPLKSVLGLIHLARNEKDPTLFNLYHDYMEKSIHNLDQVILSLVNFARNSHQEIVLSEIHLHEFIDGIIHDLAFWPEAADIDFENRVDKDYVVTTDKDRLKVIVHNIIGNGIKYSDPNKPKSYLRIEARKEGQCDIIKITDNGIGIEKEFQDRIFEMYFRASDKSKGSGLGLFIVKEIVTKLNGEIVFQSTPGMGSSFIIRLNQGS
jgi:signal transduction histidine kinase/ligand-binding sensor domain-containing protein